MEHKYIEFHHGALADTYEKQANEQGYTLGKYAESFEEVKDATLTLRFEDLLTDKQYDSVLQKLQKKLVKKLKPLEREVEK